MKHETARQFRLRMTAAVSALCIIAGSTAGVIPFCSYADGQDTAPQKSASDRSVSAGGTITAGQLSDELGLESTSVRLTIDEVLVESGDSVTAGTALYSITSDSLTKAEKTLRAELQTAEHELLQQKMDYQVDQNQAYALYQSELLLGDTAQQTYDTGLTELDNALQKAYNAYQEALDTISSTPSEISSKQTELNTAQNTTDSLQEEKNALQEELDQAKTDYTSAVSKYNSIVSEYNASAAVVRYLGKALGKDVTTVTLAQTVTANVQSQDTDTEEQAPADAENTQFSGGFDGNSDFSGGTKPDTSQTPAEKPEKSASFSDAKPDMADASMPEKTSDAAPAQDRDSVPEQENKQQSDDVTKLYESALSEYETQKASLSEADTQYQTAKEAYDTLAASMTECSTSLREAQNNVTSLNKEISTLKTTLSKAKSNLSKLRSEYNSLSASYPTDKITLKNTLNTDNAAYQNAKYHYEITCATIEQELEEKQEAYDTAEENLRIFEETLADGYIRAKQDGQVYALNGQSGRSISLNMAYVTYVDESCFTVTVEIDQNDVTQIAIGDTAMLYSSETGIANGKVTAIAAGTSTSLADVRFNVTVTADENTELYYGQSVNVYFNAGNMTSFADYQGSGGDGERPDFGGGRPDFSGGMPEGFDPANMPDFGGRKDE